ncbi:THO complex subunit 6 [Diaphorina citri]|uniref:THO complex subunit 6 n=1 Tax=Diaphorina citri TaxID=121845 RepID=A0A1S3D003_DIACI|nr:THO complex subunit 6 [Diaphorina citri]
MVDKSDYNTTLSQQCSPCGDFLLAGNMDGEIAVFNLQSIFNSSSSENTKGRPIYHFNVPQSLQVCSMTSTEQFLIVGTTTEIIGYRWDSITNSKSPEVTWTIKVPAALDMIERCDINSMLVDDSSEGLGSNLYAGCGDNKIHVFCLEDGRWIRDYKGHEDYIHSIYKL